HARSPRIDEEEVVSDRVLALGLRCSSYEPIRSRPGTDTDLEGVVVGELDRADAAKPREVDEQDLAFRSADGQGLVVWSEHSVARGVAQTQLPSRQRPQGLRIEPGELRPFEIPRLHEVGFIPEKLLTRLLRSPAGAADQHQQHG